MWTSVYSVVTLLRLGDFAAANAGGAHAQPLGPALDEGAHRLQVQIPPPLGDIVGVTDFVAKLGTSATYIANSCHYRNLLKRYCNRLARRPANQLPKNGTLDRKSPRCSGSMQVKKAIPAYSNPRHPEPAISSGQVFPLTHLSLTM